MGYGTSLGTAHEDEMSYVLEKGIADKSEKQRDDTIEINQNTRSGDFQSRFYASDASTMPLEASRKLTDALKAKGSTYLPVDDRREEDTNSPKWENVAGTLKQVAVGAGNYLWGTPQIPEAPVSDLSKKLGHEDIKIEPNIGPSLLHRAIDDVQLGANLFGVGKGEAWADKLTDDNSFSKGTTIGNKLTGSGGEERFQTWPERLARSAFTLPGDVLSGKVQPGSIQEIERAADLASVMVGGPAPVAKGLADGTLGSFAGIKSRTLPRDKLYEAHNMELDAVHPDDIWNKTGFFRGADQRWRYEISDKDATLKMDAFDKTTTINNNPNGWANTGNHGEVTESIVPKKPPEMSISDNFDAWIKGEDKFKPAILRDVIDHPELFKAYPELGTMKVEPLPQFLLDRGIKGQVSGDTIYLAPGHPEYVRSVILHEVQHGIQHHEGFAFGGMQEQFLPKELPKAVEEMSSAVKAVQKEKGVDPTTWGSLRSAVELENKGSSNPMVKEMVQEAKDKGIYNSLKHELKSEELIRQAKEEAFTKYTRLMGEVEARNVQARMHMTDFMRESLPPNRTEEIPRHLQIDSKNKSASAMSSSPEKIRSAGLKIDGEVFSGVSHLKAYELWARLNPDKALEEHTQGYITTHGRFVSREEAAKIAREADQLRGSRLLLGDRLSSADNINMVPLSLGDIISK